MEELSLSQKLSHYILENYEVSFNRRGSLKVDDFSFSGHSLAKRFCNKFLADRREQKKINEDWLLLSDKEVIEEVANILPTVVEHTTNYLNIKEIDDFRDSTGLASIKEAYLNVVPVIDMEDPKGKAYMVEKDSGRISLLEEKSWERVVGSKHVAKVMEAGYCGRFEFNPRVLEPFRKQITTLGEEMIYNKFLPPAYRFKRKSSAKLDQRFIDFLEGFFLDSCREYAYNWLYHSSFSRLPIYLVLVGAGGIGKNLLAEALKYIHGDTNFTKAPASALDTKFNGHLVDSTMIYYDECKFSAGKEGVTTRKNRLKEWANEYVPVELKGKDAQNKDIFCSAVIATNNDSDVHLERLDRKFSVMELSEERLEKRLGVDNTQFLWKYIQDPDFPHAFLNYLEDFIDPDFNVNVEYKGPKFDQLVLSSLYGWQQELLDRIQNTTMPYLSVKALKEEIALFPRHNTKVDDFLKNFTIEGHRLGSIVIIDGKPKIKINEHFLPKEIEASSIDSLE
jgi:hypothetical protein